MTMIVGIGQITLKLYHCHSLKEKRFIVKSLKDRIAARFQVSIAETDDQDLWQKATFGFAMVSSSKAIVDATFTKIRRFIEGDGRVEIIDFLSEID